jgi:hypothetical protein
MKVDMVIVLQLQAAQRSEPHPISLPGTIVEPQHSACEGRIEAKILDISEKLVAHMT